MTADPIPDAEVPASAILASARALGLGQAADRWPDEVVRAARQAAELRQSFAHPTDPADAPWARS